MRTIILIACLLMQICHSLVFAEEFPQPTILQPDKNFWLRVYTEIDTRAGFIHDSRNLAVVYQSVSLRGGPRANKKHIKHAKAKYAAVLKSLASGKRDNLTADEKKILNLWGEGVTNKRLLAAVKDIRFQRGQSDRFKKGLIRSGEWRPYIDETFAQLGLPAELAVLPHVESSFNPNAYSHVGAAGLWQFIRSTGKRYMQINYLIDERMDPFASTVAAAKLLKHNYQLTQSWPLALTAYNHGVASMRRAINKLGTRDIAIIARKYKGRSFGFASRNFYVAFLAALEIDKQPEKYFGKLNINRPYDYQLVKLDAYYFAKDIAKYLGVSKSQLKKHNRALLESVWTGSKRIPKGFNLRVPADLLSKPIGKLIAAIPKKHTYSEQTPDEFHYVQRGDTISEIADEYGYRVRDILALNNLNKADYIRAGQKLRLPVSGTVIPSQRVAKSIDITKQGDTKKKESAAPVKEESLNIASSTNENDEIQVAVSTEAEQAELDVSAVAEPELDELDSPVLLSDPADYSVDQNDTIEVHAAETLGHYAEWLDLRASRLRQINSMRFGKPVVMGKRIKLDFAEVSRDEFEKRRIAYQKDLQSNFFAQYQIQSVYQHSIKQGDSLWVLALREFKIPIWLLRQHNPDVNFQRIKPGVKIAVPRLIEATSTTS